VEVVVAAGHAAIRGEGIELDHPLAAFDVQPRLGSTPARIHLPGGGVLVTDAPIEAVLAVPRAQGLAHRLESNLWVVLASLLGLIAAGWFGYHDGIPYLAREAALRVPPEVESNIAIEGMQELDRYVFKPTTLPPDRADTLRALFAQLQAGHGVPARLELRHGDWIGANAFALPGGVVVMTDELATLLRDDGRIAAVLAHEIGHLQHRHGMRHILQDSFTALLAAAVLGDLSSLGSLAATLPALVTHTTYSRGFEREADSFAHAVLKASGRSPRLLGEALTALEDHHEKRGESCEVPLEPQEGEKDAKKPEKKKRARFSMGYLSTHPSTPERVQAAEEASK
jgi:Zn-dependent protease with chaperone function